jgi:glycosyltransferase involved in cell wall biosynthesis
VSVSEDWPDIRVARTLAGATVLQAVPSLQDDWLGRTALNLAVALLHSGARVLVAASGGSLVGELQAQGGEWVEFDFASGSPFRRRANVGTLHNLITSERIELVHAHGKEAASTVEAALHGRKVGFVTTYIGSPPAPSWRKHQADAMAHGQIVIAASEFAADLIAKRHAIRGDRIVVIPRSIDTAWFDPAIIRQDRIAALRHAWRIGRGERIVLAPGRLVSTEGQINLVDAARILVNGGLRRTVFVIASERVEDEDYGEMIDRRIAAQGLGPIFRRVGHCADMPGAYSAADLVVLPVERAKTFSVIAAEAQAMGRPVIASEVGAMPEVVLAPPHVSVANRTGWLVRPRDPMHCARALAAALALDTESWRTMGARARQVAETRYAPAQVTAATLAAYGALIDDAG